MRNKLIPPFLVFFLLSLFYPISQTHAQSTVKVGFYYYPWYSEGLGTGRHWNTTGYMPQWTVVDQPLLSWYNSQNTTILQKHFKWFEDLNIDFLILSWWGIRSYEDNTTKIIFEFVSSKYEGIKLAIMVEPYNETLDGYNYTKICNYIYQNYAKPYRKNYLHINNKPLLCWFNAPNMTDSEADRQAITENTQFEHRIIGNSQYVNWWFWDQEPKIMMKEFVTICPRYDDSRLGRPNPKVVDPNLKEGFYQKQWEKVIDWIKNGKKCKYIAIYSWNEFNERSQVEPCIDKTSVHNDPFYLYKITKEKIKYVKGVGLQTEMLTFAMATIAITSAALIAALKLATKRA